jgi:prolipoprotein diacylglyceryltransferase
MLELLFLLLMLIVLVALLVWGCRALPAERWQMVAAVPWGKNQAGQWTGRNLTWYGILSANAYVAAVSLFTVLMASVGVSVEQTLLLVTMVLLICVPASRVVARVVEGKRHTFTVAGALAVGVVVAPLAVWLMNRLAPWRGDSAVMPIAPVTAAMGIGYTLGEALGRLACISFGCCYGKRLSDAPRWLQRPLARFSLVFRGETKKAAYEGHLEGAPLVPIQALSTAVLGSAALAGTALYLAGMYRSALVASLVVAQLWRVASEFLRADDRGVSSFSAYQKLALAVAAMVAVAAWGLDPQGAPAPVLLDGLRALWSPAVILALQGLWVAICWFTGISEVTGSTVAFHVHRSRV